MSEFRKGVLRRWRVVLAATAGMCGGLLLAGCGGGDAPDESAAATSAKSPRVGGTAAASGPGAGADDSQGAPGPPGTSDASDLGSATPGERAPGGAAIADAPPADPRTEIARAAFDALFDPDLPAEQWEQQHNEIIGAGPAALPPLLEALKSSDTPRREQAASILVLLGADAAPAAEALRTALNDESPFVRANAAAALAHDPDHSAAAKPVLAELLSSPEPELRKLAAANLEGLGAAAADLVPTLTLALDDAEPAVVAPVAKLLGRIGPDARPALSKLQQIAFEQQGDVQAAAAEAVQLISAEAAP